MLHEVLSMYEHMHVDHTRLCYSSHPPINRKQIHLNIKIVCNIMYAQVEQTIVISISSDDQIGVS